MQAEHKTITQHKEAEPEHVLRMIVREPRTLVLVVRAAFQCTLQQDGRETRGGGILKGVWSQGGGVSGTFGNNYRET